MLPRRTWLCVPPLLLLTLDYSLTLSHQPASHWQGAYDAVIEGNPLARAVMLYGPVAALTGAVLYALSFTIVLLFWRNSFGFVLTFLLTFGHAIGAASWLAVYYGVPGFIAAAAVLVAAAWLLGFACRRANSAQP